MTPQQPVQLSPLGRFERILVATDNSPFSADAVKVGIAMCEKANARLFPFTMVLTNPEYETLAPLLVQKASEEARAHVDAIVAEAERRGCPPRRWWGRATARTWRSPPRRRSSMPT
jgi:nucleotide-binding universal stress UspA family protein